jgi:hypothetical protein
MNNNLLHIYCDESRQSQDRYMVLGGIVIRAKMVDSFNSTMTKFREEENMKSELKWSKVTTQKLKEYKRFVDFFFALNNTDKLHFHCLIIDNHAVDHQKFNAGDKEKGFQKFYYQLLFHCFGCAYYQEKYDTKFIIHPDQRNSRYSLEEFKNILNNGMAKKLGVAVRPFISIEPQDSHLSEPVQLNDIILGAIGFQKNGYNLLAGSRSSKIELADYIAKSAGLENLLNNTPYENKRFTIWNFKLSKK